MLERIKFYFKHSFNDLVVNKQRTLFALLCIGVGVAAIVSLQTLAVMIDRTLTGNLQEQNIGDIQATLNAYSITGNTNDSNQMSTREAHELGYLIQVNEEGGIFNENTIQLTLEGYEGIRDYLQANYDGEIDVTYRTIVSNFAEVLLGMGAGVNLVSAEGEAGSNFAPIMIDPAVYPFYSEIKLEDGRSIEQAFASHTGDLPGLVMSRDGADALRMEIGDTVNIEGTTSEFVLLGIVPTDAEIRGIMDGMMFGLYGYYYYLDQDALSYFTNKVDRVETLFIKFDDPSRMDEVLSLFRSRFPFFTFNTTDDLREINEVIAESLDTVVTVLGMLGLLLGCMGIINTMQVIVRRRTMEIAVLKTLGLQGNQVTMLFLTQALIMGVIGSIIGIFLGWLMVFVLRVSVEGVLHQGMGFVIAPSAVLNGLVIGTLVTTVFGFLPTLNAGQVRPGIVLRPDDVVLPRSGIIASIFTLILMIGVISLIAQTILKTELWMAFLIVGGAFVAAGLIFIILWILIWVVGRFMPSFGIVDIKLAKRQLRANKWRGAVTLLALVVAVFSLSTMTLFADSFTNMLNSFLNSANSQPVVIQAMLPIGNSSVERILNESEYVDNFTPVHMFGSALLQHVIKPDGTRIARDQVTQRPDGSYVSTGGMVYGLQGTPRQQIPELQMVAGVSYRDVTDESIIPIMVAETDLTRLGMINIDDKLVYNINGQNVETTIVGIFDANENMTLMSMMESGVYVATDSFAEMGITSDNIMFTASIDKSNVNRVRQEMSSIFGVVVFDTRNIEQLVTKLVAQFRAFPSVVAILGLIVGGVVIANSVALATMERRKEIAVMKSVGLQRERVLAMLLLENGLLGFVGGLLGVGSGLLILVIIAPMVNLPLTVIPYGVAFLLMSVCVVVAILAALTTAWGASSEKPLNVLRYE